jgi:hypothetical protein
MEPHTSSLLTCKPLALWRPVECLCTSMYSIAQNDVFGNRKPDTAFLQRLKSLASCRGLS